MVKKRRNIKPKKRNQRRKRTRARNLPAAYNGSSKSQFMMRKIGPTTVRVTGYDLIYDPEEKIVDGPFCTIPSNPAYWKGTRVSQIATTYAQFRPISFKVEYKPQVSTMTSGNIITGTLWNNTSSSDATKQSLATSNGGRIFPVYQRQTVPITLKSNLQQNLFNFQGYLGSDTNPFTFVAMAQHTNNIVPGYCMVHYTYDFKNPLGNGFDYETQVSTAGEIATSDVWENTTGMLLTDTFLAAIGTRLIIKVIDETVQFFLGGSRIGIVADCIIKLFKNRAKTASQQQEDIQDLSESNRIGYGAMSFLRLEEGQGVDLYLSFGHIFTIDDFVLVEPLLQSEYKFYSGLFFKLKKVGPGRYDIWTLAIENSATPLAGKGYYVLRKAYPNGTYDYSFQTMNKVNIGEVNEIGLDGVRFQIHNDDSAPITVNPMIEPTDTINWTLIKDVALEDTVTAFNVDQRTIVGQGDRVLIPIKYNQL